MSWQHRVPRITEDERQTRLARLRQMIEAEGLAGVLLGPTESLHYFTGLVWHPSERFLGALVTPATISYIVPGFERSRVETLPHLPGKFWSGKRRRAAPLSSPALLLRAADLPSTMVCRFSSIMHWQRRWVQRGLPMAGG